jgi:hypothetical protein
MDHTRRAALIERFKGAPRAVTEALNEITEAELDTRPGPDEWSPRQVVHHLADSEMIAAIRLRRLLAEDRPVIPAYDEAALARRLHYANRPIGPAVDAFRAACLTSAELLERLSEAEWAREGTHTERGRYTVEDWLVLHAGHAHEHADQIRRARVANAGPQ